MVCLDTDVIIDFLKNKMYVVKAIDELKRREEILTTSITVFELLKGIMRLEDEEEKIKTLQFLGNIRVLNFDMNASKKAASIFEALRKEGALIDTLDLMIASIALAHDVSVLTKNVKHFERVKGLKLEKIDMPSTN